MCLLRKGRSNELCVRFMDYTGSTSRSIAHYFGKSFYVRITFYENTMSLEVFLDQVRLNIYWLILFVLFLVLTYTVKTRGEKA